MAACHAVFDTYELLEAVLLQLTPFELGTAVLVCETWKEVIHSSTQLADTTVLQPEVRNFSVDLTITPRGIKQKTHFKLDGYNPNRMLSPSGVHVSLNPALPNAHVIHPPDEIDTDATDDVFQHLYSKFDEKNDFSLAHAAGTRDFATMPPVQRMCFSYNTRLMHSCSCCDSHQPITLLARGGIRIWHVEWMVRKLVKKAKKNAGAYERDAAGIRAAYGLSDLELPELRIRKDPYIVASLEVRVAGQDE